MWDFSNKLHYTKKGTILILKFSICDNSVLFPDHHTYNKPMRRQVLFYKMTFTYLEIFTFLSRAAVYANRHYLAIYQKYHPERLSKNGDGKPRIIGDVFIHPTATVHPSAVVRTVL